MAFYDLLKSVIQTVADGLGGVQKLTLGTPGSTMIYPTEPEYLRRTQETGQAWGGFYLPMILQAFGSLFDQYFISWAWVSTNGTGTNPTLRAGFNVSSVEKIEGGGILTVNFDDDYSNAYVALTAMVFGQYYVPRTVTVGGDYVQLTFYDINGSQVSINDRDICVVCLGAT